MSECKPLVSHWALTAMLVFAFSDLAVGQVAVPALSPGLAASSGKTTVATSGPSWSELSAAQKVALAPLAGSWAVTAEEQKRKWLEISRNYPRLSAAEQTTMHSRMNEWVAMSPQQRAQARLNFAKTKEVSAELTPDEKKAKWETYQSLSPEEKKGLAATAVAKPAGAATAVKPVAPQKLAVVPKNPAAASSAALSGSPSGSPAAPASPAAATAPVANKP